MIAELRIRHRRMWLGLAVIVPVIAAWAWSLRRPTIVMDALPPALVNDGRP
jgi:hypothetical protein